MKYIKYKIGQEYDVVHENSDFEESIFSEQYEQALSLVCRYLGDIGNRVLKGVWFCGERGEGKTSCMQTVLSILGYNHVDTCTKQKYKEYLSKIRCEKLTEKKIEILDVIDPSFFDECHNVLELVIGKLYIEYIQTKKMCETLDRDLNRKLIEQFQRVRQCLGILLHERKKGVDELESLDVLAAELELRKHIENAVDLYLRFCKKDVIVISIDDVDLNMEYAYEMCEQIRKFLTIPNCIVFVSVKVSQLKDAVALAKKGDLSYVKGKVVERLVDENEIYEMAKKYISKLMPVASRVSMPKTYSIAEEPLFIEGMDNWEEWKKAVKDGTYVSLKQRVLELIFSRTRYLFYNSRGLVSPIIPNNLRELMNLIGLLVSMKQIKDSTNPEESKDLGNNKQRFKTYFHTIWSTGFSQEIQKKLLPIVFNENGNYLNKEITDLLRERFFKESNSKDYEQIDFDEIEGEGKSYSDSKNDTGTQLLVKSIISSLNFGYNISCGDVLYIISLLEKEYLSEENSALLFYLESLLSMRLYEAYESITEPQGNIFPENKETENEINRIDGRFIHTNVLQRLLGGSYFTYLPGELLPKSDNQTYDLRVINGKSLIAQIKDLKKNWTIISDLDDNDEKKNKEKEFAKDFNIVEFFIWTIRYPVRSKERTDILKAGDLVRKNVVPAYLLQFTDKTGYFLFDILAPFYNVVNPEFAYKRFSGIFEEIYEVAQKMEGSILNQMLTACKDRRDYSLLLENEEGQRLHKLLSDGVLRNVEIISSLFENAKSYRNVNKQKITYEEMSKFYQKIQDSGKAIYGAEGENERYKIEFGFIKPLEVFLREIKNSEKKETFEAVFTVGKEKLNENRIPKWEEVHTKLGKAYTGAGLRSNLRKHSFFESWTGQKLKTVFPDGEMLDTNDIKDSYNQWRDRKIAELEHLAPAGEDAEVREQVANNSVPTEGEE